MAQHSPNTNVLGLVELCARVCADVRDQKKQEGILSKKRWLLSELETKCGEHNITLNKVHGQLKSVSLLALDKNILALADKALTATFVVFTCLGNDVAKTYAASKSRTIFSWRGGYEYKASVQDYTIQAGEQEKWLNIISRLLEE
jgi:hypothetical protein